MVASVTTNATGFEFGQPRRLFNTAVATAGRYPYDVSPDGQRFLVTRPTQEQGNDISVVLNWTESLRP